MKVIKIGAVWCNACNVMRPRWAKIEEKYDWLETTYYDYDENNEEIDVYDLKEDVLPAFIFLSNKNEVLEIVYGEVSEDQIDELVSKYKDQ